MDSDGSPAGIPNDFHHRFAGLLGALIALLTLTFPPLAITRYSSDQSPGIQVRQYLAQPQRPR
ncbi:MAG: hypothetical protein HC835_12870 [Oscillatoriales cyanobacterium RM2_1_1]|nr:hypothetical protein [Oscillatoriales cyanobacterium SM2_3_0]NJO46441.1 hypothetical protein [Oscillatoriales cyanobacterium RM2_1_1]